MSCSSSFAYRCTRLEKVKESSPKSLLERLFTLPGGNCVVVYGLGLYDCWLFRWLFSWSVGGEWCYLAYWFLPTSDLFSIFSFLTIAARVCCSSSRKILPLASVLVELYFYPALLVWSFFGATTKEVAYVRFS